MTWPARLLSLSVLLTATTAGSAAEFHGAYVELGRDTGVAWRPWSLDAITEARERGLPVLIDAGAAWCHPCRRMAHETDSDPGAELAYALQLEQYARAIGEATGQPALPVLFRV